MDKVKVIQDKFLNKSFISKSPDEQLKILEKPIQQFLEFYDQPETYFDPTPYKD